MIRRILSVMIAVMLLASVAATAFAAAGEGGQFAVKFDEGKPSPAKLGYAGYAAELDKTVFDGQLGALYSATSTTFRLWSPVASSVSLCLYTTGSDGEQGAEKLSETAMKFTPGNGVWSLTVKGDQKNRYYTYRVKIGDASSEVVDPYARAVGVNGDRGMIVDLKDTDPEGWAEDSFSRAAYATDAVVWEVSVRDFSASPSSGVSEANRGKFLAFTEPGTSLNGEGDIATCVAYLRRMGVNYVQINPFYDFASIDESDTVSEQYNWGYDPKNYNVPEGSYSSDPYDGRVRVKECKEMIKALHESGIGVIMDVVYNHTYYSEDSFFNRTVPYYYHRINEDGSWSNGSGCGNDVATERYMVSRYIRDSVAYWAKEYHIDGFRFDLMGLMDVDTMNGVRTSLDQLPDGEHIIMYGEAWNMKTTVPSNVRLANQSSFNQLSKRIGGFNDAARDAIKGSVFNLTEQGFVQLGKSKGGVRAAIDGDGGGWATAPNQCVNYAACHDNLTLYDKLTGSVYNDQRYDSRREDLVDMNKLSAAIVLMSRGMPFLLAGEEIARTKQGDENSYQSPVEINQIDWERMLRFTSLTEYYRGLIRIRRAVASLRDPTGNRSTLSYLTTEGKGGVAYSITAKGSPSFVAAFNGSPSEDLKVTLPEGKWVILADRDRAGLTSLGTAEGVLTVGSTSAAVLVDADSYPSIASSGAEEAVVYVRYTDSETGETLVEQKSCGSMDSDYNISIPDIVMLRYHVVGDTSVLRGTYDASCKTLTVACEEYEGSFSTVSFVYLDDNDREVAPSAVMTNVSGQQYYTPAFPSVMGYRLDLDRLPANGSGKFADEPIRVVYRYVVDAGESVPADSHKTCRANVICMGSDGEVLDTLTLTGAAGESVEFDCPDFSGYDYVSLSDNYAVFGRAETTVMVNYAPSRSRLWLILVIVGAVVLLAGGGFCLYRMSARRRKIGAISIDD